MSFLSIAFLAALPLAAAPILLHLFDRRRNVVIEWGAMRFLLEAASARTSARRLKQWLLLLLRVCAIAALVLALAGPMLPGNWFGGSGRGETLLVIDNSMSMTRRTTETTLLEAAIDRAIEELDEVETGDSVRVLLASPYPIWGIGGSLRLDEGSRPLIEQQLREIRATDGQSDLLSALFAAVQAELDPTQRRRRIVLLTDGQSRDWKLDDEAGWSRFRDVLQSTAVPTALEIVELEQTVDSQENVAVDRVRASRTVAGVNQTISLTAQIQNQGASASAPGPLRWTIDGEAVHHSPLPALQAGHGQDVSWEHSFSRTGVYSVSCSLDADDTLLSDNHATVVVQVVDRVPVVVIESAPERAEIQQDAYFVLAALGWVDGAPLDVRGVHEPTLIDPERLASSDLSRQRAVVIPNFTSLSEEAVDRLREFVEDGGGLWLALGPRTDVETFNQRLFAEGNGLAPLAIDQIVDDQRRFEDGEPSSAQTAIDPFGDSHPSTRELTDSQQLDLGEVTVSRRFRFAPPVEEDDVSVLLQLTNGDPLAVEKLVGRGRVIVQAVPLRMQWSTLARSQSFVVMVQEWLDYLSEPGAGRHNLSAGEPIAVRLSDSDVRDATLHTPHGDAVELTADILPEGVLFHTNRTILPGDYWLELGLSGDRIPFHVQRNAEESDLTPLTDEDRKLLAGVTGLHQKILSAEMSLSNQSEPLWPLLLMILVGLIAAELLLAGMISRERYGAAPIIETSQHGGGETAQKPISFGRKSEGLSMGDSGVDRGPRQTVEL